MGSDNKTSRLSFRVTSEDPDEIDRMVTTHTEIKDRSDFATKAVKLYLRYIEEVMGLGNNVKEALLEISKNIGDIKDPELRNILLRLEHSQ